MTGKRRGSKEPSPESADASSTAGEPRRYRVDGQRRVKARESFSEYKARIREARARADEIVAARKEMSGLVRSKGVLTIPQAIRIALDLEEGDQVIFSIRDGNIVVTPATVVPRDQEWFWTQEWQEMEAEADAEIAAGGGELHDSDEAFIAAIKAA